MQQYIGNDNWESASKEFHYKLCEAPIVVVTTYVTSTNELHLLQARSTLSMQKVGSLGPSDRCNF